MTVSRHQLGDHQNVQTHRGVQGLLAVPVICHMPAAKPWPTVPLQVYRGISGKALPTDFWKANRFGVRGGVENAFMSTTLERSVALQYASGGKMGILIEVQQGMDNRGADMSKLSQCARLSLFSDCTACSWARALR